MRITVSASADGEEWHNCHTILNIGNAYPQDDGFITEKESEWYSPLLDLGTLCNYIRIIVDEVNYRSHTAQDNNFFTDFGLSELQLYSPFDTSIGENVTRKLSNSQSIYDLSGRRLHTQPTEKGLYIMNGRKIIVK
jgi:hypothetical protein